MEEHVVVPLLLLLVVVGCEATASDSDMSRLLEWVRGLNGGAEGLNPKVSIESVPGMGSGMVAVANVKEGEWVTRTPLSAVINIEHAFASEEFGPIADRLERTTSNTNLKALFLATERNRGAMSTWAPYLASLPRQISSSLSFDGHEIEELQASMVKGFVVKQQDTARKAYHQIRQKTLTFQDDLSPIVSEEDLLWAVSVWTSRAHLVRVLDRDGQWQSASCLVPLADLLNMARSGEESNTQCGTNENSTHFECYTTQQVGRGTQLLAEYITDPTMRHNGRLLMHYGIALPDNPFNSVSVEVPGLDASTPNYPSRKKLVEKLQHTKQAFIQLSWPNSSASPDVLKLVAVTRLAAGTMMEVKRAAQLEPPFSEPLGSKSERKALQRARDHLSGVLSSYATTAEFDAELLSRDDEQLSENRRNAIILRLEEKRLLKANMAALQGMLDSLHVDRQAERKRSEL